MNLRDFRIGWRLLLQQPAYSAVVIGGLAIGFAACFLLFGFVEFCLNFNSARPDNDRVVVVKQRINVFPRPEWQTRAFLPLRDVAIASGSVVCPAVKSCAPAIEVIIGINEFGLSAPERWSESRPPQPVKICSSLRPLCC